MSIFLWCILFFPSAHAETVEELYEQGQKYVKRGYYTKALESFNNVRNYYRDDPLAQMAELAIADVYFKKAEWDLARYSYDDFRRRYPRHEKADYATFQIGMSFYKKAPKFSGRDQKWTESTIAVWNGFETRYPESEHLTEMQELRSECLERLAKKELGIAEFYEKRKAWDAVRRRGEGLVQDFPQSSHVPEAYALLVQAYVELGDRSAAEMALDRLRSSHPEEATRLQEKYWKTDKN